MKTFAYSSVLLTMLALAGCTSLEEKTKDLGRAQDDTLGRISDLRKATAPATSTDSHDVRQKVDGAWVTNASTPANVMRRPPAFDLNIQIERAKPLTASEVATRITLLTGMPVVLAPDVYRIPLDAKISSFNGTVEELLNRVAGSSRLSMRLENGGVTLFRYETAVLRVKRKPGKLNTQTQIGVSSSSTASSSGTNSSGDMAASINGTSSYDPWTELASKVKAVLTPEGKVQEAAATSTIVITDVPEAVALARKVVEDDNILATTAITVKVEVITITDDKDQNLGVNWNVVFNQIEAGNPLATLTFAGPAALTSAASNFKVTVPSGSASQFANSDYLIQALNKVGKAQTLLRRDFTTIHNVPSGFSRTNSKSYRAKTTAAPASSVGGAGQVGVEPGQVVTGTRFIVTPTYLGDGQYSVELTYNDTFLKELVSLGTGQQQIDAPDVDGNQMYNITTLNVGETSILNAFEIESSKAANQGLTANTTSQMTSNGNKTRIYMLVTVTGGPR